MKIDLHMKLLLREHSRLETVFARKVYDSNKSTISFKFLNHNATLLPVSEVVMAAGSWSCASGVRHGAADAKILPRPGRQDSRVRGVVVAHW